ncbi:hypothetical protein [Cohnella sp. GCM10027633]|uniref:hypothetical protein n=1 Tax=unclassified Cohnella TaxID=2636738 RepID=UPI003625069B
MGWFEKHKSEAKGERLRRLVKKLGYGEKLLLQQAWWPAVGNLDHLVPEFEFIGFDGKHYFMDYAYLQLPKPTAMEADSYGSHARDIDREEFSRGLDRQNEIVLTNWNILRFSTDKLKENPTACQQTIKRMFVSWYGGEDEMMAGLNIYQREIVRIALRSPVPFAQEDIRLALGKGETFTRAQLQELIVNEILEPAYDGERQRIHRYRLKASAFPNLL